MKEEERRRERAVLLADSLLTNQPDNHQAVTTCGSAASQFNILASTHSPADDTLSPPADNTLPYILPSQGCDLEVEHIYIQSPIASAHRIPNLKVSLPIDDPFKLKNLEVFGFLSQSSLNIVTEI